MEKIMDLIGHALYEEVFARNEFRLDSFTMENAMKFFINCAEKDKRVRECWLEIEPKGTNYKIFQLMLDEKGMPLMADAHSYMGRIVKARELADNVVEFMDGKNDKKMKLPF